MPEPFWRNDVKGGSMAEAGIKVNTTTTSVFVVEGYTPIAPKPLVCVPMAGKRQTGPAAMNYPFT
jgi:hypothetical protein